MSNSESMVETGNERECIRASQAGDHAAFEELVRRHQRMIHALTFRMTGSLVESEDLAQEAFVQAWHHLEQFRGESTFASWLYRIAVNLCLTWRKRAVHREIAHRDWAEHIAAQSPDGASPHRTAPSERVQEALLKLPSKQRAAVILTAYDGLNHAEAAQALGCSETTVSWRLFAARAKLKRLLKDVVRSKGAGQ